MYSISSSKNIENITQLPDDILYNILSKCNTSSTLNLNKTNKLFNFLIKNDLEDNKIIKLDSEIFQIELIFYLELSENEYIKLDSSLENIYNYIKLITVNYEFSEPLYKGTKIIPAKKDKKRYI